jgi:hypothetical protein
MSMFLKMDHFRVVRTEMGNYVNFGIGIIRLINNLLKPPVLNLIISAG